MSERENQPPRWSWISSLRSLSVQKTNHRDGANAVAAQTQEEDNPWLRLHEKHPTGTDGVQVHKDALEHSSNANRDNDPLPLYQRSREGARWLSDNDGLGSTDLDGTLRQVESQSWRIPFGVRRNKVFVPATTSNRNRWQNQQTPSNPGTQSTSVGNTLLLQTIFALVLVASGFYAKHYTTTAAEKIRGIYTSAFSQDFAVTTLPQVETFLKRHHIAVPTFLNSGVLVLHPPISGSIVHDYTINRPVMVLAGVSGEAVLAAGTGIITVVEKASDGYSIAIDHGKNGVTWYTGIVHPSVHVHESVTSGQMIGKLTHSAHPELGFALKRDGSYVNPHDYIRFPESLS